MDWHAAGLRRLDGIIWAMIAGVAGLALLTGPLYGFHLVADSFVAPAGTCLLLIGGALYYSRRRDDPHLASALGCTAQLIAFAAVGAPLSYVAAAAGAGLPLHDAAAAAFDRAFDFDWRGLLATLEQWPHVQIAMRTIYMSLSAQMTVAVLVLGFSARLAWLRVYTLAFIFAALITIAISAVLPTEGVWLHDGLHAANHTVVPASSTSWPVFLGLRDGSYRLLEGVGAEGIITFPSLHAALAVIIVAALWPLRMARWVCVLINAAMLAATPIEGSHYLADVLAGLVVAAVSLAAARALVARLAAAPQAMESLVATDPETELEPVPVPSLSSSSR
ncbi:MAG: phosphatase PAP2 family protein [Pseudolabrys sp.]|jgi:hypothetical protein